MKNPNRITVIDGHLTLQLDVSNETPISAKEMVEHIMGVFVDYIGNDCEKFPPHVTMRIE